jgi:flagellar protein FliS
MSSLHRAARTYQENQVVTRSPLELVVMLYDGAMSALTACADASERGDRATRGAALSKTLAILGTLQSTLNMERGGQVAIELDQLYTYMAHRLTHANVTQTVEPIHEVRRLLSGLRDGWAQIAASASPPAR